LTHEYEQIGKYAQTIFESRIKARAPGDSEITGLTIPFVKIISLLKDDYFSNEAEARIVAFRPQKKIEDHARHAVAYRQTDGFGIPYIKIFDGSLLGEHCPIERIIIGPHSDNKRRRLAVETFLKIEGLEKIEVTTSQVPFIS